MSDGNVLRLKPRERLKVKSDRDYTRPVCPHSVALVDENARIFECETCKAPLDPIGYLSRMATEEERDGERERAASHLDLLLAWFTGAGGTLSIGPGGRVKIRLPLPSGAKCEFSTSGFEIGVHRIRYALDEALRRFKAGGVIAV